MPGPRLPALLALVVAAVAAAAACGSGSSGAAHPRTSPAKTVTRTVTTPPPATTPPPGPSRPAPGGATPAPRSSSPAARDAAAVVTAYFDAINAHDYRAAWDLGGRNLSPSYAAFVQGFATTALDTAAITRSGASTVALTLTAVQTDGSVKTYAGTYTVGDGVIVSADVHQTGGSGPAAGPIPPGGFRNCTEARQHGYSDIPRTSPAYQPRLDRDHDGVACEPYEGP